MRTSDLVPQWNISPPPPTNLRWAFSLVCLFVWQICFFAVVFVPMLEPRGLPRDCFDFKIQDHVTISTEKWHTRVPATVYPLWDTHADTHAVFPIIHADALSFQKMFYNVSDIPNPRCRANMKLRWRSGGLRVQIETRVVGYIFVPTHPLLGHVVVGLVFSLRNKMTYRGSVWNVWALKKKKSKNISRQGNGRGWGGVGVGFLSENCMCRNFTRDIRGH